MSELREQQRSAARLLAQHGHATEAQRMLAKVGESRLDVPPPVAWISWACLALTALTIVILATAPSDDPVHATTTMPGGAFPPQNAVDGERTTEWLGADLTTGALTLRFEPQRVARVVVYPGSNPPHLDRGAASVRLVVLRGRDAIAEREVSIPEPARQMAPLELDVGLHADGLRLEVDSFHGSGLAIAEIDVEPAPTFR